jgi:light-regulated signal transduction histidine kinase (bacteriophytochrome)
MVMQANLAIGNTHTVDLMKMVRRSLQTIRTLLVGGSEGEETTAQIQQLEQLEQLLLDQEARLDAINRVLEEFNYSVSHELFAPLRRISGFTREIKQRYGEDIDVDGVHCLNNILESSQQMNSLIDALMQLSQLGHVELHRVQVDLSEVARGVADELTLSEPQRQVAISITPKLQASGDPCLLKIGLRKLLENAWKFTGRTGNALIEFGAFDVEAGKVFYVRDNGAGFEMADYDRLFHPFQRLHDCTLFTGNGIGLTAVKRIIERHGGKIWAEGARDQGATFYFTL